MTPPLTRRPHEELPESEADPRLPEINLYFGNLCNRDCDFCCVEGTPGGDYRPFDTDAPRRILRLLHPEGRIKLYGGEPTLHLDDLKALIRGLRDAEYRGRLTVFSNGVQARRLIRLLESDPPTEASRGSDAYLNYRIWHGLGVEPPPPGAVRLLEEWGEENPGRLWLGHEDLLPVGAGEEGAATARHPQTAGGKPEGAAAPDFGGSCARCWPTVRSDGHLHACAFAVEEGAERYGLGRLGDGPRVVAERHRAFLEWVDRELEPAARAAGESPCTTCLRWARETSELVTIDLEGGRSPGRVAGKPRWPPAPR